LERFFKTNFLFKDAEGLSAIEPITYQERFMVRIGGIMNLTDEGTVPGIVDTMPATFPKQSSNLHLGYVNDQGSYQDASKMAVSGFNGGSSGGSGGGSLPNSGNRRMTKEEYREMRNNSITAGNTNSLRVSSMSAASHAASLFESTSTHFDGISSAQSNQLDSDV
jgi:hypothetical protein